MAVWSDHWDCCPGHHNGTTEWYGVDGSIDCQEEESQQEAEKGEAVREEHCSETTEVDDGRDSNDGRREH